MARKTMLRRGRAWTSLRECILNLMFNGVPTSAEDPEHRDIRLPNLRTLRSGGLASDLAAGSNFSY